MNQSLFQYLFASSDDFKADPRGYLSNQAGHVFLGFTMITFYCWALDKLDGYPSQHLAFYLVVVAYLVLWELLNHGWKGFDTIEDTAYFGAGASTYLFIEMQWVIDRLFVALLVICICLGIGTYRRWQDID